MSALSHQALRRPRPCGEPSLARTPERDASLRSGSARDLEDTAVRGSTIGRYVVLERVGSGGMGVVFAAYDPDLDRRVAVKVMRANVRRAASASEGRARLLREAQAMAKLHHENVVAVHDVGTVEERVFIAMEYLDGGTVGSWLRRRRRSQREVLDVFIQAGRGLAAAHAEGLVHRDFKPDNVLLQRAEEGGAPARVAVVDFGLARRSDSGVRRSGNDVTDPGDPATTAPEGVGDPAPRGGLRRPTRGQLRTKRPATPGDTVELSDPGAPVPPPGDGLGGAPGSAGGSGAAQPLHERDTRRLSDPLARATPRPDAEDRRPVDLGSDLTRTGAVVGTPAYMAPEQHRGEAATERSDQFSFCVSLYEALYGERPFGGGNQAELVVNITDGNLRPLPADPRVRPWLRRVMLRGLSLDPARRFASMNALLDALDRGQARRKRWLLRGSVAGGVVLLAATLWATADDPRSMCGRAGEHLVGVWDDARRSELATAFDAVDKPYARDAWKGTARALDDYSARWVAARIDACEATHVRGEQSEARLDLRMRCLDERLSGVRAVTSLLAEADGALVAGAIDAVQGLAAPERCGDADHLQARDDEPEDPEVRAVIAEQRRALVEADALIHAHRLSEAGAKIDQAIATARELGYRPLLAQALLDRGDALEAADELEAARSTVTDALLVAEAGGRGDLAAVAWADLVWIDGYRRAEFGRGHEAAAHAEALLKGADSDPKLRGLVHSRVGDLLHAEGRYEQALAEHTAALALRVETHGRGHVSAADSHTGIGSALVELGRYAQALDHYDRALAILEGTYGGRHPNLAHALTNIGMTQEYLGDDVAACETHRRALRVAEDAFGPDHDAVANILNNYAAALHARGDLEGARTHFERALAIWQAEHGADHPDVAMVRENLAVIAEEAARSPTTP